MHLKDYRAQLKEYGLGARKQKGLEVLNVTYNGTELFSISYTEIHNLPFCAVKEHLASELKPEYIPPLG